MVYKPLRGMLIGEIVDGDYQTESGLYVVSGMKNQKPRRVRILSTGAPFRKEYRAKVGDIAHFKLSAGRKLTIGRKRCLLLANEDIVGVENG